MAGGWLAHSAFRLSHRLFFFDVDDTKPLDMADSIIGYIAEIIK